jgi:hypothetical protein
LAITSGHGIAAAAAGTAKHGISATGSGAIGANAGGDGFNATGGAASTTGGGTAGVGMRAKGGAGAASTNGSGDGFVTDPGGTVTVSRGVALKSVDFTGAVVSDAGNTSSTFKTDLAESTNDHWKDALLRFTSGSLKGQIKKISAYDGTSKFVTVSSAFTAAPTAADTFDLINE